MAHLSLGCLVNSPIDGESILPALMLSVSRRMKNGVVVHPIEKLLFPPPPEGIPQQNMFDRVLFHVRPLEGLREALATILKVF